MRIIQNAITAIVLLASTVTPSGAASLGIQALNDGRFKIVGTQDTKGTFVTNNWTNVGLYSSQPYVGGVFNGTAISVLDLDWGTRRLTNVGYESILSAMSTNLFKTYLSQGTVLKLDPMKHTGPTRVCISQWMDKTTDGIVSYTDNGSCATIDPNKSSCELTTPSLQIDMPPINIRDLPSTSGGHTNVFGSKDLNLNCTSPTSAIISFSGLKGANNKLFYTSSEQGTATGVAYYLYANNMAVTQDTNLQINGIKTGDNPISVRAEYASTENTNRSAGKANATVTFNVSYQ